MKKLLILILAVLLAATFAGCTDSNNSGATEDEAAATTSQVDEPIKVYEIKTKYCILKYPEKFKDKVKVDIDTKNVYTVKFSLGGVKLFDLCFNGGTGDLLGTIKGEDGNTEIRATVYDLDKKAGNYSELREAQGSLNVIIDNLKKDYKLETEQTQVNTDDVFEIETSLTTLYYPSVWKNSVKIDKDDKSVRFSYGKTKLFDLEFGGESKGYLAGTYKDTNVYVVSYDIKKDSFSEAEYNKIMGMQSGLNTILEYLQKDDNFKISRS